MLTALMAATLDPMVTAQAITERDRLRERIRVLEERCSELKAMLSDALDREAALLQDQGRSHDR